MGAYDHFADSLIISGEKIPVFGEIRYLLLQGLLDLRGFDLRGFDLRGFLKGFYSSIFAVLFLYLRGFLRAKLYIVHRMLVLEAKCNACVIFTDFDAMLKHSIKFSFIYLSTCCFFVGGGVKI